MYLRTADNSVLIRSSVDILTVQFLATTFQLRVRRHVLSVLGGPYRTVVHALPVALIIRAAKLLAFDTSWVTVPRSFEPPILGAEVATDAELR
jgi:hypothetical protein